MTARCQVLGTSLGRHATLRVSARGIKTTDRKGIDAVVAEILTRGEKL